jgi:PGAP1-like protein
VPKKPAVVPRAKAVINNRVTAPPAPIEPGLLTDLQMTSMLASGEQVAVLKAYFGVDEYDQLRKLARRVVKLKKPSKGRVYLLPGMMGSTLGFKSTGKMPPQVIWLNPRSIAAGGMLDMALPAKPDLQPLSVMLPGYLKLKMHLQLAGFDAVLHAFDWRKSVVETGKILAQRIAREGFKKVSIVAHSMGGLVARIALTHDKKKRVGRVVQIGSPNFGSFVIVQALRGAYPTVRKVSALDPERSTDQLVRHVFRTLPGLYEMLPAPEHTKDLDLQQIDNWPDDLSGPDATLINTAMPMRARLGKSRAGCFHIVGVNQETVTRVRLSTKKDVIGFEYGISLDGDGTVPRALSEWPGAQSWFVQERHGNLPNNDVVCKSVIDLLSHGATRRLARELEPQRTIVRWVTDAEYRHGTLGGHDGKVNWNSLPLDERRRILEPAISPEFHRGFATNHSAKA